MLNLTTGDLDEKKVRPKNIPDSYWAEFVKYQPFYDFVKNKYTIGLKSMIATDAEELVEIDEED